MKPTQVMLIAHTPSASALLAGAHHVLGGLPDHVMALDVPADATPDATAQQAQHLLTQRGAGQVLLLSDLRGGTPCNAAEHVAACWPLPARLVVGLNLPMLLELLQLPACSPAVQLAWRARSAGRRWVRAPRLGHTVRHGDHGGR